MGDQLRYSPEGPRELNDRDFGATKPKVVFNQYEDTTKGTAHGEAVVDPTEHESLLGGTIHAFAALPLT